jgi:hypothetical protein
LQFHPYQFPFYFDFPFIFASFLFPLSRPLSEFFVPEANAARRWQAGSFLGLPFARVRSAIHVQDFTRRERGVRQEQNRIHYFLDFPHPANRVQPRSNSIYRSGVEVGITNAGFCSLG